MSGNNSVVECDLAKVEVAGSNPVSRSNKFKDLADMVKSFFRYFFPILHPFVEKTNGNLCNHLDGKAGN